MTNDESFDPFIGVQEVQLPVIPEAECVDNKGQPILQHSMTDTLINNEVLLPHGEELIIAKVLRQLVEEQGKVIGNTDENPILNTLIYDVEFPDGNIKKYSANVIAENVFVNCDYEGYYSSMMACILDHKRDGSALRMNEKYIKSQNGQMKLRQTSVGWSFLVRMKDGTESWTSLRVLKESNHVDIAEYVLARKINNEPEFAWWVPYT